MGDGFSLRFSDLGMHLQAPGVADSVGLGGLQTSSQAMMMMLVWGSHLQKHQALRILRTAKCFLVMKRENKL